MPLDFWPSTVARSQVCNQHTNQEDSVKYEPAKMMIIKPDIYDEKERNDDPKQRGTTLPA
jgi:hypothetical protein